ncbi:MAG TPA: M1 family metallopeptidase [Aquihabitans sp.]|nr:M1 family metallopeptidase [Aquihabitans sp.]
MRRALATVLVVALAGCSAAGSSDGAATPSDGPAGAPTTTEALTFDDRPDDVADEVFADLGDPRIDVRSYDVDVRADPGDPRIEGEVTMALAPTGDDALRDFTLDLKGPEITDASVDGEPAQVQAGDAEVVITPAQPLLGGDEVEATFTYEGEPSQAPFPVFGITVGWQPDDEGGWFTMSEPAGTSSWVPCNDHPSDKATWRVTLDVPEDTEGISNGRLEGDGPEVADGRARWTWSEDEPMASYLVLAAVGDYDLVTADADGVRTTYAFPTSLDERGRRGFDRTPEIVAWFAEQFGPYPADDSGAIVVPTDLGVALEVQTRPLFGLDDTGAAVGALAHELAHQWFGDAVGPERWDDLWLNEGFATYADWMWGEHDGGDTVDEEAARAHERQGDTSIPVHDPQAAATFDFLIYEGGALVLHALRHEVGDEAFFEILRRWVAEHRGSTATTADFVALASDVAGRDLQELFTAWLDRAPLPDLPR